MDDRSGSSPIAADTDDPGDSVRIGALDRGAAVARAFEDYHAELLSFLRRSTRDDEVAEDLAQEAFLRLAREVAAGRRPDHPRAWLYRVASNLVVSRARRGRTVMAWLARYGQPAARSESDASPEEGFLRRERRSELEAVLGTLSPDARTALLLSGQGFTGFEIAAAIGRSPGATRSLLTRTRISLRLALEAEGQRP
jgi:RNA polymerase sigma-70 factor (ECF subfamily)